MTPKLLSPEDLALRIGRLRRSLASFGTEFAGLLDQSLHEVEAHIAALEKERDAALADNAALLRQMRGAKAALTQHATFPADVMCTVDILTDAPDESHPGVALLEEHRKALVRARNEGLEKAATRMAQRCINPASSACRCMAHEDAMTIRAMKEPE